MERGRRISAVGSVLSVVLAATACDSESDDPFHDDELSFRVGGGVWLGNGLEDPDVSGLDPAHGLATKQGLRPDAALLNDGEGASLATYLVECALPEGDSITKVRGTETFVLWGALGLAPEWKDGPCDDDCQEWVSACLLARTNATGQTVGLWLNASHPAIGFGDNPEYPVYEATFYGNVFQDVDAMYLCTGISADGQPLGPPSRTCGGEPLEDCGFTDWGHCSAPDRCLTDTGHDTDCATGVDPTTGVRFNSISTYVSLDGGEVGSG